MHDAGQHFSLEFARALAARAVRDALEAVGGSGSTAGSAFWYVAGLQPSLKEWALRDGRLFFKVSRFV